MKQLIALAAVLLAGCTSTAHDTQCPIVPATVSTVTAEYAVLQTPNGTLQLPADEHTEGDTVWLLGYADSDTMSQAVCGTVFKVLQRTP